MNIFHLNNKNLGNTAQAHRKKEKKALQPSGRMYLMYFWGVLALCLIFYGTSASSIFAFDETQ